MKWSIAELPDDDALAPFRAAMTEHVRRLTIKKAAQDEDTIRELLSRWVSGCEPAVAMNDDLEIIGLCDADVPLGTRNTYILRVE